MKKKEKQICMSCLEEFDEKDVYWIMKNDHMVLYCSDCIEKKGIEPFEPYLKKKKK